MARFYGSVHGSRGVASRLGGAGSGMSTVAAGWQGSVKVYLFDHEGVDWCEIRLDTWNSGGTCKPLYRGPVNYEAMDAATKWRVDHPIAMKVKRGKGK